MNWLWFFIGAVIFIVVLKIIFKTLKIVFIFTLISVLMVLFYLWQQGILIPN